MKNKKFLKRMEKQGVSLAVCMAMSATTLAGGTLTFADDTSGTVIMETKSEDDIAQKLAPDSLYSVDISLSDKIWEIASYANFQGATITTDSAGKAYIDITFFESWSGTKLEEFKVHQTSGSTEESDLLPTVLTPASGTVGWKDISGIVRVPLSYVNGDNYTGTYRLSNGTSAEYVLEIKWETLKSLENSKNVEMPVIFPEGGSFHTPTQVTITCETEGAEIHYTLDGSEPTKESPLYTEDTQIIIREDVKVRAKAFKDGMNESYEKQVDYKWSALGDITSVALVKESTHNILTLKTKDATYSKAVQDGDDFLPYSKYFIQVSQGDITEKFIYNGGIGGFGIQKHEEEVKLNLGLDSEKWDINKPLLAEIVMDGYDTKKIWIQLNGEGDTTYTQENTTDSAIGGKEISIKNVEPGNKYTANFNAYRIDDGATESMLAGFFDKSVELEVKEDGSMLASFYNIVYAHSMLDFAIQGSDGEWKGAVKDGVRLPETDIKNQVVAAVYTIPVKLNENLELVGAVNVAAMGGSDTMTGLYDRYTQVKLVFGNTVTEGFHDFSVKDSGINDAKRLNRALMTYSDMDTNGDSFISDEEMKNYHFSSGQLDFSFSRMMSNYNVFDDFKLQDISWLKKIGDTSITTINLNGLGISEIRDEFQNFTELTELNLSANCISFVANDAFHQNKKLHTLKLSTNLLTEIDRQLFAGLTVLGTGRDSILDLENNRISRIEDGAFDDLEHITGLYLARNQISSIDAKVFPERENFTFLSLSNNQLMEIPTNLGDLPGLESLYLDNNEISEIGGRLSRLPSIRTITLGNNHITELEDDMISTNESLSSLEVSNNSITSVPESLLHKIADSKGYFESIFEYNAIDAKQLNLETYTDEQRGRITKAATKFPSKNEIGLRLTVEDGALSYQSQISMFDYYYWTRCKGRYVSWYIQDKLREELGKNCIDTVEELQQFMEKDLPDFSEESIHQSILTSITGTVDSFQIKTELQELKNGTWNTIFTTTELQTSDSKTKTIPYGSASEDGRYRLIKTVKNDKETFEIVTYAGNGDGTENQRGRLADGIYAVNIEMLKLNRQEKSMANQAVEHTAKLEVKNGVYYLTIDFKGMQIENRFGYLSKLFYYGEGYVYNKYGNPVGDLYAAEVISTQRDDNGKEVIDVYNDKHNPYPDNVRIQLSETAINDEEGYVPLRVFVPIMEAISKGTGNQDVLLKIDWESLKAASEHEDNFKPEQKEPLSPAVDYTDAKTGIRIQADRGTFEKDVRFEIHEIVDGDIFEHAKESGLEKFRLFEIKAIDKNGKEIQPNGVITVSYPVEQGLQTEQISLYRINEDGSKTRIKGEMRDNYYVALQKSLSVSAVVLKEEAKTAENLGEHEEKKANSEKVTEQKNQLLHTQKLSKDDKTSTGQQKNEASPKTGDLAQTNVLVLTLGMAGVIAMAACRKRRRE